VLNYVSRHEDIYLTKHHAMTYGGVKVELHTFLTSVLDGFTYRLVR